MNRTLKKAVWVVTGILVLGLVIALSGKNKLVIWSAGMCLIVVTTLKWSGFKGLSTLLSWLAFGFFIYTYLWLRPMGMVQDIHIWLLAALSFGLGLWDNHRSPKVQATENKGTDEPDIS